MIRRIMAALLAATLATACTSSDKSEKSVQSVKVTYVTAFGAVGRDAFIWVAEDKGFFAEQGLDVDIQKGAGNVQNLTLIKSGRAQLAALDFTGAEIQAGGGQFTDWRAVAAVQQQTLVSIMTTKDTGITKPTDLAGKTVATAKGSVSELLFPAYARLSGLDPTTVKMHGAQTTALNGLMAQRKVDALSTFLLSKVALETAAKKEVVVLPYSDVLKDLFGNAIIARQEFLASDRATVQKFVDAAMKGLQYTIDHPQEAAEILHKAEPTAAVPAAVGEITAMKPYVSPLGRMNEERVTRSIKVLEEQGLVATPAGLTADQVADFSFVK